MDVSTPFAKALVMGIALASNVGGMTSPISSPQVGVHRTLCRGGGGRGSAARRPPASIRSLVGVPPPAAAVVWCGGPQGLHHLVTLSSPALAFSLPKRLLFVRAHGILLPSPEWRVWWRCAVLSPKRCPTPTPRP